MLGLNSIEGYMDAAKLKLVRRILLLPSHCISKKILLQRIFQAQLMPGFVKGFSGEIIDICNKYQVSWILDNYVKYLLLPDKIPWKTTIQDAVNYNEFNIFKDAIIADREFARFVKVHPDPFIPSPIWRVAKKHPHMLQRCYQAAKAVAYPHIWQEGILCEHCGVLSKDYLMHYVMDCPFLSEERETFWDIILNSIGVEAAAYLYNLEDDKLLLEMLQVSCCGH